MITTKLHLNAIFRGLIGWNGHDTSTVDEVVDLFNLGRDCFSSLSNRFQVGKVKVDEEDSNRRAERLDLVDDRSDLGLGTTK